MISAAALHLASARYLVYGIGGLGCALALGGYVRWHTNTRSSAVQLSSVAGALSGIAQHFRQNRLAPEHLELLKNTLPGLTAPARNAISSELRDIQNLIDLAALAHVIDGRVELGLIGGATRIENWIAASEMLAQRLRTIVAVLELHGTVPEMLSQPPRSEQGSSSSEKGRPLDLSLCLCGDELGLNEECGWCRAHYELGSDKIRLLIDSKRAQRQRLN